jgi:hypothetical protein
MTPGKGEYTADVVAVFMGDQYARQVFRTPPQTGKSPDCLALAKAAIDHQAGGAALDQQRIPRAAAAKRRKTYHCNC